MHVIPKEKKPLTHTQKNLSEEKIVSEGKKTCESAAYQVPRSSSACTGSVMHPRSVSQQKDIQYEISSGLIQTNLHDKVYQNAG